MESGGSSRSSEDTRSARDPSRDPRANYDYQGGEEHRPDLVAALEARIEGDVRFDEYSRQLYATDASAYEVTPVGVVFPKSTDDVAAVMGYCAEQSVPVLPRGGGTSLAGQAVNEAVVLDFTKHMDDVLAVDPDPDDPADASADVPGLARAQPGVTLGELNAACDDYGLTFAPDPAWGDKSALGGAIGNNSTGAHSLVYGKTDAYVESCEVVLADGTVTTLGEVDLQTIREEADPDPADDALLPQIYEAVRRIVDDHAEAIDDAYPDMKRNVSGYNLDRLVAEARGGIGPTGEEFGESGTVNLARLLAGSEGTLGIVTEATVSLEPLPETKAVALLAYDDLVTAMEDVQPILAHDPAAVEVLDDVLLSLAQDTEEFGALVETVVPDGTGALLLVEFYARDDAHGREQVADLLADRVPADARTTEIEPPGEIRTDADHRAFAGLEAHDAAERERFWKLRKSGLPILLSRTTDEKHISFIEDCAVPPEHLPEYVQRFQGILEEHDTFASFYAHAGPGVLHVRPLINTKSFDGVERMVSIADAVTDLVVELGGSVSGEHGDGRARSQWNRKLYGDDVWELSRDLKAAFDPDWLLNPGQVCGDATGAIDMAEHLRFDPEYQFDAGFDPALAWENENGMQGMVELCHGCGGCRGTQEETGGVMCPTYRAAEEESLSTRGRANALRQAMSGDLPDDATEEEFVEEILDLCIGCKGCARDCPSEVDMATLKAELTHQHHQEHGTSVRDRLFGDIRRWAKIGSATAPVSNWLASLPGSGWLAEKTVGIASERELPTFARTSFSDWMAGRDPAIDADAAERRALVFPDTYTEYIEPEIGKAAVRVLEAANVRVEIPDDVTDSGRPAFSKGLLDRARERAERNVAALEPRIEAGWDVVTVEPSEAAMFQSDYATLLGSDRVATVAANTYGVMEYADRFDLELGADGADGGADEQLLYHGHCHQTAIGREHHAPTILERAGYDVEVLDSGCCGMAGSFGYEAEHVSMSEAIGGILFDQVDDAADRLDDPEPEVVAPGTSCRSQFGDLSDRSATHPVVKLAGAVQ
ncbi:FAD-binding and (Fe-S)-binding domain-containing protein [Salinarchaeum chitinilyticum]